MRRELVRFLLSFFAMLAFGLAGAPARAQGPDPTFSVDFQGVTGAGAPDAFFAAPIGGADILTTGPPGLLGPNPLLPGPLPFPGIEVGGAPAAAGAVPGGLGIVPSGACGITELDALSYGKDWGTQLFFSVDEFATGVASPLAPNVFTEAAAGEASPDYFTYLGPFIPTPPGPPIGNTAAADGNGFVPSGAPGWGGIEPNPPSPGALPDPGDNLDGLDVNTVFADLTGPIFFSLDSLFADPLEPVPPFPNCGTAPFNGFSGADVLVSFAGGAPVLAIPAGLLGLDLGGFDTDDLDALIFYDADGSLTLTPGDMIYFSVRRGSAVIGALDSAFGAPIEPGDVLTVPAGPPGTPAIFIAAEAMGLGTARSATAGPFGPDDVDALDVIEYLFAPPVPSLGPWGLGALAAVLAAGPLLGLRLRRRRRTQAFGT